MASSACCIVTELNTENSEVKAFSYIALASSFKERAESTFP